MHSREEVVFHSFITELKALFVSENLTNEVANTLFQNQGIISLQYVLDLKSEKDEEERAQTLLTKLDQLILDDNLQFEVIADELGSFDGLKPVVRRMKDKWCK